MLLPFDARQHFLHVVEAADKATAQIPRDEAIGFPGRGRFVEKFKTTAQSFIDCRFEGRSAPLGKTL